MALIQLDDVTVSFGGPPILDGVNLVFDSGERLCLLGRNGAGKSTLLRVILGLLEPNSGKVTRNSGVHIAYLDQQVPEDLSGTVLDVAMSGRGCFPPRAIEEHVARASVSRVGLKPDDDVATLSAGARRRALLAAALSSQPSLLLLDEPTNHLDVEAIAWLEEFLVRQKQTLLFVTHDRMFLRRLATGILDLDRGAVTRFPPDYDDYIDRKRGILASEAKANSELDKTLAEEEVWIRRGVRERRKRNIGRVGRLMELREQRSSRRDVKGSVKMQAQSAARSGRLVLEAKNIEFSWEGKRVADDFSITVMRGDRVAFVGPNGSGKTTLLRVLLKELEAKSGTLRHGTNLEIAYFDQLHADLDLDATAIDNVSDGASTVMVNGVSRHVIGYLRDFLFTADQARSPIRRFSGGERNRLLLARIFARPSNVLVMDEPTNDLDVETLEVLQALLSDYEGSLLVVSHDRTLLDAIATSLVIVDGEGGVTEFIGGYSEWRTRKEAEAKKSKKASKGTRAMKAVDGAPKKLSWNERKELEGLPAELEAIEAEQAKLHEKMADPGFFKSGSADVAALTERLDVLDKALVAAYARWEALEERA